MQAEKACYLYYGENEYLIERKLKESITILKIQHGNIYEELLSPEIDIDTLLLMLDTLPLLTQKRIYILKNPIFFDKKMSKLDEIKLVSYFDNPNYETIFILILTRTRKNNTLLKNLADRSESKYYGSVDQRNQSQILNLWEEQYEKKIDKNARVYLLDKMKYIPLNILEEEFVCWWFGQNISRAFKKSRNT